MSVLKRMEIHDLVIIGGGPSGIACAIEAKRRGKSYVVLEKGVLANSIYNFPINMTFFSTSEKLEIGEVPFISHSDKPKRREALEYYRRLRESYDLNVELYTRVEHLHRLDDGTYRVETSRGEFYGRNVVVATGYYDLPRLLNVPGEDLPKVKHYYDDAHPYVGQKVLVIGAANSACDVALETYYKGSVVTMAIRESEIYPKVKYWIRPNIENRIAEGSIKAYFNTTVVAIREQEVDLQTPEGLITIENDFVLAMTGYQPDFSFLEKLGICVPTAAPRIPEHHPETLETNLPGVYLAGVIAAGLLTSKLFIENTRDHGTIILDAIEQHQAALH